LSRATTSRAVELLGSLPRGFRLPVSTVSLIDDLAASIDHVMRADRKF